MLSNFVVPGQTITSEQGYLRGHGTYLSETSTGGPCLIAAVAGQIERVNKLISVKPGKSRYIGEVGDLVVGRVTAVDSKRWKVDVCGQKDAMLQLSSVNLPGGVQRMRTYEDQLQMRTLFEENDLVCAEIQNINSDGVLSLHSRSMKYGKLENGQLVCVPSALMKRLPQHYISLPSIGMDLIMGKNGFIWITRSIPEHWKAQEEGNGDELVPLAETLQNLRAKHNSTPLLSEDRLKSSRLHNAILALASKTLLITPEVILSVYSKSVELSMHPKDMLGAAQVEIITEQLLA